MQPETKGGATMNTMPTFPKPSACEDRILREQFAVRRQRIRLWNIVPGVLEVAAYVGFLFVATELLGVLLAWVLYGGPRGSYTEPAVLWARGMALGATIQIACAISYYLGARGK